MRSIYRIAALRTFPLPKPSQLPSCLHCPVRQRLTYSPNTLPPLTLRRPVRPRLTYFPPQLVRHHFFQHKKIATRFRMTTFHPLFFLTAIQNMIPTLTQTITFSFLFYSGFHPDIFPKIPAYSLPAVEYFKTYSVSVLHPIGQLT